MKTSSRISPRGGGVALPIADAIEESVRAEQLTVTATMAMRMAGRRMFESVYGETHAPVPH
jgi:hypothetical protein